MGRHRFRHPPDSRAARADGPTKDDESRHVPLVPALADVLREWQKHCPVSSAATFPPVGSIHKLAAVLGHRSTEVTMRYGHLVPGEYTEAERALVDLDLSPAKVLPLQKRR